jgi:hypothetical protein
MSITRDDKGVTVVTEVYDSVTTTKRFNYNEIYIFTGQGYSRGKAVDYGTAAFIFKPLTKNSEGTRAVGNRKLLIDSGKDDTDFDNNSAVAWHSYSIWEINKVLPTLGLDDLSLYKIEQVVNKTIKIYMADIVYSRLLKEDT